MVKANKKLERYVSEKMGIARSRSNCQLIVHDADLSNMIETAYEAGRISELSAVVAYLRRVSDVGASVYANDVIKTLCTRLADEIQHDKHHD